MLRKLGDEYNAHESALNFVYTRCALPNFCLRSSNNFGELQKRFKNHLKTNLVLLTVTFDPVHDSPEAMAKYARRWNADPNAWHFLTGSESAIRRVCDLLAKIISPMRWIIPYTPRLSIEAGVSWQIWKAMNLALNNSVIWWRRLSVECNRNTMRTRHFRRFGPKLEQPFWAESLLSSRYTPDRNQQSFRERDLHHHPCGGIVRKEFSKKAIQFSEVGDIRHEYGGVHH